MTLHVMLVQDVHYVFGVGFKLQRPKNRTLGHAAVGGETGRRSIGIAEQLSAVIEDELTPFSQPERTVSTELIQVSRGRRFQTLH